jgi:hypothetical protein
MPKDTATPNAKGTTNAGARKRTTGITGRRRASAPAITHEQIALRAYEIHLEGTEGDAVAHWLRAERELVGA